MKVSIGFILSLFMTVLVISSAGCIDIPDITINIGGDDDGPKVDVTKDEDKDSKEDLTKDEDEDSKEDLIKDEDKDSKEDVAKTVTPVSYSSSYKVTPLDNEFAGAYYDSENEKIYVEYNVAKVDNVVIDAISDARKYTVQETMNFEKKVSNADEVTTRLDNMVSSVNGGDSHFAWNIEAEASADIKGIVDISVKGSVSSEDNRHWETTKVTTDTLSTLVSSQSMETIGDTIDCSNLEEGMIYQYAVLGDCLVKQVFVYDLVNGGSVETYSTIELIGKSYIELLSSEDGELPVPEYGDLMIDSVDMADLLEIDGTVFMISTDKDLMLMQFDKTKSYKLVKTIELGSAAWFDPDKHIPSSFETGNYLIYYDNNKFYPSGVVEIWNSDQFMNNIMYNPSGNYILMADIDLTGITIPADVHFRGVLDGNNKKIIGNSNPLSLLWFHGEETTDGRSIVFPKENFDDGKSVGLFAKNSGEIKDLILSNFRIIGKESHYVKGKAVYVGCIAGENSGTISNVQLENCWIECFRTNSYVGTVAGKNTGTIINCELNQCYVYGNGNVGGVVGLNDGYITSCYVVGSGSEGHNNRFLYVNKRSEDMITSHGGIVGEATVSSRITDVSIKDALIETRYHEKDVKVQVYAGKIAGKNAGKIDGVRISNVKYGLRNHENDAVSNSKIRSIAPSAEASYFPSPGYVGYQTETGNLINVEDEDV